MASREAVINFAPPSILTPAVSAALLMVLSACGGGSSSTVGCAGCPTANAEVLYVEQPGQIQVFPIDLNTGALGTPLTTAVSGAGMIATPNSKFMFVSDPQNNQINGFTIDSTTGALTPLASSPVSLSSKTHTAIDGGIDPAGKFLYLSDLDAADILAFSIDATTGTVTAVLESPFNSGPYPGRVIVSPSNFAEVLDGGLGLSSYVMNSSSGVLTPGASGPFTYLNSGGATDIVVHASGQYLYMSQGMISSDSGVAAFTLDQTTGFPTPFSRTAFPTGLAPVSMATDPGTKFLYTANSGEGTISGFSIDSTTGILVPVPGTPFFATTRPPSGGFIKFQLATDPSGHFLYATNPPKQSISVFSVSSTGALTQLGSAPFNAQPERLLTISLPHL